MGNFLNIVLLAAFLISGMSYAGESIDRSLALNNASKVIIENKRGKVKIVSSDDSTISVTGELDEQTESFIFKQSGATIFIKVEIPNSQSFWNKKGDNGSNLVITVPRQVKVGFTGVSSDVNVSGFEQGVDIKTVSGEITASHLQKRIDVTSISGDINTNDLSGKIKLSTVSGDINDKLSLGRLLIKSVSGSIHTQSNAPEVSVETVSGNMNLTLSVVDELDVNTVSGDSEVYLTLNEKGEVKLASVSGDFDMHFSKNIEANFCLKTNSSGSIINKLTDDKAHKEKYGPNEKLNFRVGNGNGLVKVNSVSGDITLSTY